MLEDFVDVSSDEKDIMHLWNSFVRKQRYPFNTSLASKLCCMGPRDFAIVISLNVLLNCTIGNLERQQFGFAIAEFLPTVIAPGLVKHFLYFMRRSFQAACR